MTPRNVNRIVLVVLAALAALLVACRIAIPFGYEPADKDGTVVEVPTRGHVTFGLDWDVEPVTQPAP